MTFKTPEQIARCAGWDCDTKTGTIFRVRKDVQQQAPSWEEAVQIGLRPVFGDNVMWVPNDSDRLPVVGRLCSDPAGSGTGLVDIQCWPETGSGRSNLTDRYLSSGVLQRLPEVGDAVFLNAPPEHRGWHLMHATRTVSGQIDSPDALVVLCPENNAPGDYLTVLASQVSLEELPEPQAENTANSFASSAVPTQTQMFYDAVRRLGERDQLFMELVQGEDGMTRDELETNIARRPAHWSRYENFLSLLPLGKKSFDREALILDVHFDDDKGALVWGPYVSDPDRNARHLEAMSAFDEDTRKMFREGGCTEGFASEDEAVEMRREGFLDFMRRDMKGDVMNMDFSKASGRRVIVVNALVQPAREALLDLCYKQYRKTAAERLALPVKKDAAVEHDSAPSSARTNVADAPSPDM